MLRNSEPGPGGCEGEGATGVVDDDAFLNDFADRLILGGAWAWADLG